MIYLDGAATTPVLPEVKKAILDAFDSLISNPSALHSSGHSTSVFIEDVRARLASFIGARPGEIIFTSGATEGNNTIMHIFEGKKITFSPYEHPSVSVPATFYRGEGSPTLYSHLLLSNETGQIFTKKELNVPKNTFFHSDLTQAFGKIAINVKKQGLDYATIAFHKVGGPLGIGALYVRDLDRPTSVPFAPLLLGGSQESSHRAGTPVAPLIAGVGALLDILSAPDFSENVNNHLRPLWRKLKQGIEDSIPHSHFNLKSESSTHPSILNVSFPGAEGESIALHLDLEAGIEVTTGSACANGSPSASVLALAKSAGYTEEEAIEFSHSSIRFSLTSQTTESDIDAVLSVLPKIIKNLRNISTINPERQK